MDGKRGQAALAPWLGMRLLLAPKLLLLPPLLLPPGLASQMATLGLTQRMTTLGMTQQGPQRGPRGPKGTRRGPRVHHFLQKIDNAALDC